MKIQKQFLPTTILCIFTTILVFSQQLKTSVNQNQKTDTIKVKRKTVSPILYATEQSLELLVKEKRAVIVHYGLVPVFNLDFEKKYGIKIHNEGCVIMSGEKNPAKINNILISKYLVKNFGEIWKKDLGFTPFGLD